MCKNIIILKFRHYNIHLLSMLYNILDSSKKFRKKTSNPHIVISLIIIMCNKMVEINYLSVPNCCIRYS